MVRAGEFEGQRNAERELSGKVSQKRTLLKILCTNACSLGSRRRWSSLYGHIQNCKIIGIPEKGRGELIWLGI